MDPGLIENQHPFLTCKNRKQIAESVKFSNENNFRRFPDDFVLYKKTISFFKIIVENVKCSKRKKSVVFYFIFFVISQKKTLVSKKDFKGIWRH